MPSRRTDRSRRAAVLVAVASLAGSLLGAGGLGATAAAAATSWTTATAGQPAPLPNPLATRAVALDPGQAGAALAAARARGDVAATADLARLASTPTLRWLGEWVPTPSTAAHVAAYASTARRAGRLPAVVLYAVPHRDCGAYSRGGHPTAAAYRAWVTEVVRGLAGGASVAVVEPDALPLLGCLDATRQTERLRLLSWTVQTLRAAGITPYLDAGGPEWVPAATMAGRLRAAGVGHARGVSLNVSNYHTTATVVAYAHALAARLPGLHAVIDTSRNGRGAVSGAWCNVTGRRVGQAPRPTADPVVDALLWVKRPGESDGDCGRGEPPAGRFWEAYARGLVRP